MKRFFVATPDDGMKYFVCHGDEHKLCKGCVARFCCYTGELPYCFCEKSKVTRDPFSHTFENTLFGSRLGILVYDYDADFVRLQN